eukprot:15332247-Ditylum_brightwellii.AAC.2
MSTRAVDCNARRTRQYYTFPVDVSSWQAPSIQSATTKCANIFTGAYYKTTTYLLTPIGRNKSQNQRH